MGKDRKWPPWKIILPKNEISRKWIFVTFLMFLNILQYLFIYPRDFKIMKANLAYKAECNLFLTDSGNRILSRYLFQHLTFFFHKLSSEFISYNMNFNMYLNFGVLSLEICQCDTSNLLSQEMIFHNIHICNL